MSRAISWRRGVVYVVIVFALLALLIVLLALLGRLGFSFHLPAISLVVAMYLLYRNYKVREPLLLVSGLVWLSFAVWEFLAEARITCDEDCNIRVDWLFILPVLMALLVVAVGESLKRKGHA